LSRLRVVRSSDRKLATDEPASWPRFALCMPAGTRLLGADISK
jgi:hypothetical protein